MQFDGAVVTVSIGCNTSVGGGGGVEGMHAGNFLKRQHAW